MTNPANDKEESVDELIKKLAKKGKKVKLIDETGSVKELPVQENNDVVEEDPDLDRKSAEQVNDKDSIDEIKEEVPAAPANVQKKESKTNVDREEDVEEQIEEQSQLQEQPPEEQEEVPSEKVLEEDPDIHSAEKLLEQQAQQQQVIEQTNAALQEEAKRREDLE